MVQRLLSLTAALISALPALGAEPRAVSDDQGIALENGLIRAVFSAGANYTLTELRRLPDGPNLLAHCLVGYTVDGARYWYQDNKTDEFGLRPVSTRVDQGAERVTLTVTYPAQGEARHFAVTKVHTLRAGATVLENEYRVEAVREVALRGGLSLPLIRFAPQLTGVVVPQVDGSLTLGEAGAVQRGSGAPRWVGAYSPESGEGLAFTTVAGEPQVRREGEWLASSLTAIAEGAVQAGSRAVTRFGLAVFSGRPIEASLATALGGAPGLPELVRFGKVRDMTSERFDATDLSLWEQYRETVSHPATFIKPADLEVARQNVARHDWARSLLNSYRGRADYVLSQPPGFVESMISATTPLCTLFTMCPHCEYAPIHGQYTWDVKRPDELKCRNCGTVYPNASYPEDLVLTARHGGDQRFTYYGGKGWPFNNITLRSSWTGSIRARKNEYMARAARDLAIVYALTGEAAYAAGAAAILSRFATVYPNYLVHSGYGEIADLDPRTAAKAINSLPADELTCPPNRPDRKLHAGYWMAGRAFSAVGMEGTFLAALAEAYDLVAGTMPDAERRRVERDLLNEGSYLLLADTSLNNKTATNRSAVGEVGMAVGEPRYVRFALSGLRWFIDEWYLPDGAPSESPAYGNMTLGGIWRFADAVHGYSDPPGYQPPTGRFDQLDIYGEARYRSVFQVLADALLPNFKYPPIADSQPETGLSWEIADVMAARYDGSFRELLRELTGGLEKRGSEWALFHRDPALTDQGPVPRVGFPDVFFPAWRMAYLRSGADGRRGAAVVSASDWGGHHHWDSLNLFYWQDGHELLTDLGYLWDNPDKHHLSRTAAHNLVVVDEAEQRAAGRGGRLHRFAVSPSARLVEVSSAAYPQVSDYRRTVFLVDHEDGTYLVDLFRVAGGAKHDYLFHGPNPDLTLIGFDGVEAAELKAYGVSAVRRSAGAAPWTATWALPDDYRFQAISLPDAGEASFLGLGWGQRTPAQTGLRIPYVVRRREAPAPLSSAFVSVFEGYRGQPAVKAASRLDSGVEGGQAVMVERADGGRDYLFSLPDGVQAKLATHAGELVAEGHGVLSTRGEGIRFAWLVGGACLEWQGRRLSLAEPIRRGRVTAVENAGQESWLELDQALPERLVDTTLAAGQGAELTGYRILRIDGRRVYVRLAGQGVDALPADHWELAESAYLSSEQGAG